jgi:DNA-binding transcriptional LysR family regulator
MDYREQVFMAVAENLNFTKAAESLFISQPAVTKHIHELESKSGIALFTRKGNRISLTQAGEIMYNRLRTIDNMYNELNYELSTLKGESEGTLRLGASSTIAQYVVPTLLAAFRKRYPKITLHMVSGNSQQMENMLAENNIDIALVENSSGAPNLRYTPFMQDNVVAVAGSGSLYARKKSLTVNDLEAAPLIVREQGSGTLQTLMQALLNAGLHPEQLNIVATLGATEAIKNFLTVYDGIAFISERAIGKELQFGLLTALTVKNFTITRSFRMAERQGPTLHTQETFSSFMLHYNF